MNRKSFLRILLTGIGLSPLSRYIHASPHLESFLMTVNGPLDLSKAGTILPHEHAMVDFVGAEKVSKDRYDRDKVFKRVLPYLEEAKTKGCQTFVECTPQYLGRDAVLLQQLSDATGLNIVTNTGYYAASKYKYLPEHAYTESADQLMQRWLQEWKNGIDGTDIKPGFIKISLDPGEQPEMDIKMLRAAARLHQETGLTIAQHNSSGKWIFDGSHRVMDILKEENVHPNAWIWVHAQNQDNLQYHVFAARKGGWVEFDGIGADNIDQYVKLVKNMKDKGVLDKTLISQDNGWYSVGEANGGDFKPYTIIFDQFIPALKAAGFTDKELDQLLVKNPAEAYAVRKRLMEGE